MFTWLHRYILIATAMLVSLGSAFEATVYPWGQAKEYAEDLESEGVTSFASVKARFLALGGTLRRLSPSAGATAFQLHHGDVVYPVCSAGFCRSQTLWILLESYGAAITLMPPHAAGYGFDPYNGKVNWRINRSEEAKASQSDDFRLWAHRDKALRFGYDRFQHLADAEVTAEELDAIKAFYSTHYYGPAQIGQRRRVYLAFAQNAHIVMHRLCESNKDLSNVVVVHLPMQDLITTPPASWETYPRSKIAYERYHALLKPLFELSRE